MLYKQGQVEQDGRPSQETASCREFGPGFPYSPADGVSLKAEALRMGGGEWLVKVSEHKVKNSGRGMGPLSPGDLCSVCHRRAVRASMAERQAHLLRSPWQSHMAAEHSGSAREEEEHRNLTHNAVGSCDGCLPLTSGGVFAQKAA
ncbi:hypothetical protein DPEC_G00298370 [Dallia pectoralis]|uniref:Uncharacterized protein n=1 Tax=Dallia pectoralis TaxID=75939 RepID=A0ACC2FFX3_DALPE|nr:hypothetical protein DPEC_G00298370 [Dallia pectoralis]